MLTGSQDLLDHARNVSLHGMSREAWSRYAAGGKWAYDIVEPGFKYTMTDIQAAIGLQQLRRFTRMQDRRRQIVEMYNEAFSRHSPFLTPVTRSHVTNAWHLYVLRLRAGELSIGRDQFIQEMTARKIGTSVHFIPIHRHPHFAGSLGYGPDAFPVADDAYRRAITLPLFPRMSDRDVDDVCEAVRKVAAHHRH